MKKLLIAITVFSTFCSCSNYYKAIITRGPLTADSIEQLRMQHKYFILRNGPVSLAMTNIALTTDRKNIQCTLDTLPDEHILYLTKGLNGNMKYRKTDPDNGNEAAVLNEVHLYTNPNINTPTGPYTMPLSNIQKAALLEKDKIRTRRNHTVAIIATVAGTAILIYGIAAISFANAFLGIL